MNTFETEKHWLGIDIGSVSLSYVLMNQNKQILKSDYLFHQGNIYNLLKEKLDEIDLSRVYQVAYNHRSSDFFVLGESVNEQVALIEGARYQQQKRAEPVYDGGETFGLILFDEKKSISEIYFQLFLCGRNRGVPGSTGRTAGAPKQRLNSVNWQPHSRRTSKNSDPVRCFCKNGSNSLPTARSFY